MIPAEKYCPSCNRRFTVNPNIREDSCPSCGVTYRVNQALRDTKRTRGGFTIELIYGDIIRNSLLDYIFLNPATCANDCSIELKRAPGTIRAYVKILVEEDLVVVDKRTIPHRYYCSEYYIPTKEEKEAREVKTCVFCGKNTLTLKKGKCESCIAQHALIRERFNQLNAEAEKNINVLQRCKNAVTV